MRDIRLSVVWWLPFGVQKAKRLQEVDWQGVSWGMVDEYVKGEMERNNDMLDGASTKQHRQGKETEKKQQQD